MNNDLLSPVGLSETHSVSRLIPGDVDSLTADARGLRDASDTLFAAADAVRGADLGGWIGAAADAYAGSSAALRTSLLVAAMNLSTAADALSAHASTLEWAQDQARTAIRVYDSSAMCMAPGPLGLPTLNPGQTRAETILADARAEAGYDAMRTAEVLRDATEDAPINPGAWNMAGYQWSEFWRGGAESITGIGHLLWDYSTPRLIIDHEGVNKSAHELAEGLTYDAAHPMEFVKGAVDYDTWTTSPARAAGHLVPDVIIATATAGSATVASRTASAASRATEVAAKTTADVAAANGASAAEIIQSTARSQAARGAEELAGALSPAERAAMQSEPWLQRPMLGQAVHRSTADALDEAFPGRFQYSTRGPDFLDTLTGERLELTTPGQVGAHLARPGYEGVTMCTYVLGGC